VSLAGSRLLVTNASRRYHRIARLQSPVVRTLHGLTRERQSIETLDSPSDVLIRSMRSVAAP